MLFENWYIRSVQETQIDSSKDSANWVLEWGITINSQLGPWDENRYPTEYSLHFPA